MYRDLDDGNVQLTLSRDDFQQLMFFLGVAAGSLARDGEKQQGRLVFALLNRMNEGNPLYRPYQLPGENPSTPAQQ